MNTSVTQCSRCGGAGGAHFAFCFVAQVWERLLGPGYPWAPAAPTEPDIPPPPEPDDFEEMFDPDLWRQDPGELYDPPDPQGVYEDFLVGSGQVESDTEWMPDDHFWEEWHAARQLDTDLSTEVAVTHLPENYYGEPEKPARRYNTGPMRAAHEAKLREQEDAAVVFVYDVCDLVPGGRMLLSELHERYVEWQKANDMPSMSKARLRNLLAEVGLQVEPGRLPGARTAGRPPLLVSGVSLRPTETVVVTSQERVPVTVTPKLKSRHALIGAKPGGEIPKWARDMIEPLITEQGWEYQPSNGNGRGKPRVKSPDGRVCTLPSTAHSNGHAIENTRSFLKANGAVL